MTVLVNPYAFTVAEPPEETIYAFTDLLSVARASAGYAQTAAGTLTSFAANTLRITDRGLLVEESRANAQKYSQDIANAYWTKAALTLGTTTAPDGTSTATTLTDDATNTYHRFYSGYDASVTAGANVQSVYAKAGTLSWIQLQGNIWCNFNLTTGTMGSTGGSGAFFAMRQLGSTGWWLCQCIQLGAGATSAFGSQVFMLDSDINSAAPTYAGSGSGTVHVWGIQVENGAYPTSYIPTTSAAVTRAADVVTFIGDADTMLSGSAASVVADMDPMPRSASASHIVSSQPTTGHYGLSRASETSVATHNGATLTKSGLGDARTAATKNGACWSGAGRSVTAEGAAVATDASGTVPSLDTIYCGSGGTAFFVDSYVQRLRLWDTRLSDAELVTETT